MSNWERLEKVWTYGFMRSGFNGYDQRIPVGMVTSMATFNTRSRDLEKMAMKQAKVHAGSAHLRETVENERVRGQRKKNQGKKNTKRSVMGDKVGRIHVHKQNFDHISTRKMKGLRGAGGEKQGGGGKRRKKN